MEIIVGDRVHLGTAKGIHRCDSRRVERQGPWSCMMTFQDSETYNWYLEGRAKDYVFVLDPSELPDKVEEVKFWGGHCPSGTSQLQCYAIGKVVIGSDFE